MGTGRCHGRFGDRDWGVADEASSAAYGGAFGDGGGG